MINLCVPSTIHRCVRKNFPKTEASPTSTAQQQQQQTTPLNAVPLMKIWRNCFTLITIILILIDS